MMWDRIMELVTAEMLDDDLLAAIFGTSIRQAPTSGEMIVPVLEWTLIGDAEGELWVSMIVQFDFFLESPEDSRMVERRLRSLYHRDLQRSIGPFTMFTQYVDGTMLAVPDRANYSGRSIRFQMTSLREQYAGVL